MKIALPDLNDILKSLDLSLDTNFGEDNQLVVSRSQKSNVSIDSIDNFLGSIIDEKIVDQNYRLSKICENKNIKLVVSIDRLFWTKFDRIIINEYFYSLQEGGYLVIISDSAELPNSVQYLKKQLKNDYKGSFEFFASTQINRCDVVVFQKTFVPRVLESDIRKWTFGFIGNGEKDQFIADQIEQIKKLPLKEWEVIICGTYNLPIDDDNVRYIHFTENDDKGWITKKKNLIAQAASHENLIILHDRYFVPSNFVEKMEEWGNDFELLGARQILYRSPLRIYKTRIQDWMMTPYGIQLDKDIRWKFSYFFLEYSDWDILAYLPGGLFIVKRSLMLKVAQDEEMFWNSPEDIKFCQDFSVNGYCLRVNSALEFETASFSHAVEELSFRLLSEDRYLKDVKQYHPSLLVYEGFVEKLMPRYIQRKYEIEALTALRLFFSDDIPCYIFNANPINKMQSIEELFDWYYKLMTIDAVRILLCNMNVEQKINLINRVFMRRTIADENLLNVIVKNFKSVHYFDERAFIQTLLNTGEIQRRLNNMTVPNYPFEEVKNLFHMRIALMLQPLAVMIIELFYKSPKVYRLFAHCSKFFFRLISPKP